MEYCMVVKSILLCSFWQLIYQGQSHAEKGPNKDDMQICKAFFLREYCFIFFVLNETMDVNSLWESFHNTYKSNYAVYFKLTQYSCMSSYMPIKLEERSLFKIQNDNRGYPWMVGLWMIFIYLFLFLAVVSLLLGLFSSCGKWGLLSSCCVRASHGGFSCVDHGL